MNPADAGRAWLLLAVTVSAAGCHAAPRTAPGPALQEQLQFAARADVSGEDSKMLVVSVTALNVGATPIRLELRCDMTQARLLPAAGGGRHAWDSEAWARDRAAAAARRGTYYLGCIGIREETVLPGATVHGYDLAVPVSEIVGRRHPPGTYRVAARVRVNGRVVGPIDAGDVELRVAPQ